MPRQVDDRIPVVTHFGTLSIGEETVECGMTDDERRVLLTSHIAEFIGYKSHSAAIHGGLKFPRFMLGNGVRKHLEGLFTDPENSPFWVEVPHEVAQGVTRVNKAVAFPATVLPDICWGFVDAQLARDLRASQRHIYERCIAILRELTRVAMVALVDEATGYQRERNHVELQTLLLEKRRRHSNRDQRAWTWA